MQRAFAILCGLAAMIAVDMTMTGGAVTGRAATELHRQVVALVGGIL